MTGTPSPRARPCPNCKLELLPEAAVPPHRLKIARGVGVSVYGGNGLCPASRGPWDGPAFFGGTDWRGQAWEYARGEEPTLTVRWAQ